MVGFVESIEDPNLIGLIRAFLADPEIAQAPNAAARGRLTAKLGQAEPGSRERALYDEFECAKRIAEASSVFARVPEDDPGDVLSGKRKSALGFS